MIYVNFIMTVIIVSEKEIGGNTIIRPLEYLHKPIYLNALAHN
jgi:hypothetical protein